MLLIDSNGLDSILNTISTHSREIDALIRMAGGTLYKFEKAEGEAHTVDVPTGAKMGDILSIGGKSFVLNNLWNNTLTKSNSSTWASAGGITYVANGRKIIGTFNEAKTISNYTYNTYFGNNSISVTFKKNHTYYVAIDYTTSFAYTNDYIYLYTTATNTLGRGDGSKYRQKYTYTGDDSAMTSFRFYNKGASASIVAGDTITIEVKYLVDLTQAGLDDLTLDECNALFTGDIPYNTGEIVTVKSDMLVSKSRNLFDKDSITTNSFLGNSGEVVTHSSYLWSVSGYIEAKPSQAYYFTNMVNLSAKKCVAYYTKDKIFISLDGIYKANSSNASGSLTTPSNCAYFRICFMTTDLDSVQVELGNTATTYSPYFTTTTPILPCVTQAEAKCYRINADIKDTIDYAQRKITHKVGKANLSSYTWTRYDSDGTTFWYTTNADLLNDGTTNTTVTVFKTDYDMTRYCKYSGTGQLRLYTTNTVAPSGFLYYPLATPTEENLADIIPENSAWLDTYGASAGTVYNEIDFANRKYIQRVGKVDIGNLGWALSSNGQNVFYVRIADITLGVNGNQRGLCSKYLMSKVWATFDTMLDKTIYHNPTERTLIYIKDTAYTDATAFKSAMSGVYLYYELANPIETDISNYLTDELTFKVEAGGTITLENTNDKNIPVPYSLEYAIALREVARYEQS